MTSADDRTNDLLDALRASWPRREALRELAEQHASDLAEALDKLTQEVPNHRLESVDAPLKEAAVTLANGYLAEQTKGGSRRKLAVIINDAAASGSLSDVLLTAGCALQDDACNLRLLDLVKQDVAKRLIVKWGPGKANAVIDDLPSHLYSPLTRGFNRGRMRLLDFYGRSTLKTWLHTVAANRAIDLFLKTKEETDDGDNPPDRTELPIDPEREKVLQTLVEKATQVAAELIESLRVSSPQQYNAAILRLRKGYTNAEIAERLGCKPPAVTQLLDKVSRKFLELLSAADPCFRDAIDTPSSKDKKWIEEAIFGLLLAEEDPRPTDSPDASDNASDES